MRRLVARSLLTALVAMPPGRTHESPPTLWRVAHAYSLGVGELPAPRRAKRRSTWWKQRFRRDSVLSALLTARLPRRGGERRLVAR